MRVLVLGGTGFIGRQVAAVAARCGLKAVLRRTKVRGSHRKQCVRSSGPTFGR